MLTFFKIGEHLNNFYRSKYMSTWQVREMERLNNSEYIKVVWDGLRLQDGDGEDKVFHNHTPEHGMWDLSGVDNPDYYRFTHVSLKNPNLISYTENANKGLKDIQTPMKVGRYLKKFYPKLTDKSIAYWVAEHVEKFGEKFEVKFATTPDEIEMVYNEGPNSCMSKNNGDFISTVHPCRAYGAGDLAVAYIERNDRITARVVCWPEKKVFSTIYGDSDRMKPALDGIDYIPGSIEGAKLLKIFHPTKIPRKRGAVVAPYLDGNQTLSVGTKFMYVGSRKGWKTFCAEYTNGLSVSLDKCYTCSDEVDPDEAGYMGDNYFCNKHFKEIGFRCRECEYNYTLRIDHVEISDKISYCYECYNSLYFQCDCCLKVKYHTNRSGTTGDKREICTTCYEKKKEYSPCKRCGELIFKNGGKCSRHGAIAKADRKKALGSIGSMLDNMSSTFSNFYVGRSSVVAIDELDHGITATQARLEPSGPAEPVLDAETLNAFRLAENGWFSSDTNYGNSTFNETVEEEDNEL